MWWRSPAGSWGRAAARESTAARTRDCIWGGSFHSEDSDETFWSPNKLEQLVLLTKPGKQGETKRTNISLRRSAFWKPLLCRPSLTLSSWSAIPRSTEATSSFRCRRWDHGQTGPSVLARQAPDYQGEWLPRGATQRAKDRRWSITKNKKYRSSNCMVSYKSFVLWIVYCIDLREYSNYAQSSHASPDSLKRNKQDNFGRIPPDFLVGGPQTNHRILNNLVCAAT